MEGARSVRDRLRLAQLLLSRRHPEGALKELDRVAFRRLPAASTDPVFRSVRALSLQGASRGDDADALLADPKQVVASYGPWWAQRGDRARMRGDEETAAESFSEALAVDPFDVESACGAAGGVAKSDDLLGSGSASAASGGASAVSGGASATSGSTLAVSGGATATPGNASAALLCAADRSRARASE